MEALEGRGGIAPTHSRPRHWMGSVVSVTPRPRFIPRKGTLVSIVQEAGWATELEEKSFRLCQGSNLGHLVVQSVVRHCTD
jgi:hypothetical protein